MVAFFTILFYPFIIFITIFVALYYRFSGYKTIGETFFDGTEQTKEEKNKVENKLDQQLARYYLGILPLMMVLVMVT